MKKFLIYTSYFLLSTSGIAQNDPLFTQQNNLRMMNFNEANNILSNRGNSIKSKVVIAVIDGGFNLDNPEINWFKNKAETAGNNLDDDGNGYIDDVTGWDAVENNNSVGKECQVPKSSGPGYDNLMVEHGTQSSSMIGAICNNSHGMCGVCPNVQILPIQLCAVSDLGSFTRAIDYIVKMKKDYISSNGVKGALIVAVNLSMGFKAGVNQTLNDFSDLCSQINKLKNSGIIFVNSAGNDGRLLSDVNSEPQIPTMCNPFDNFIRVANIQDNGDIVYPEIVKYDQIKKGGNTQELTHPKGNASFSGFVDFGAPGTKVWLESHDLTTDKFQVQGSGTSFSAPTVSGLIGLMYSTMCETEVSNFLSSPNSYYTNIIDKLKSSAMKSPDLYVYDSDNEIWKFGTTFGVLNLYNAVLKNFIDAIPKNLTVEGNFTENKIFRATENITIRNFTKSPQVEITFIAGNEIITESTSILDANCDLIIDHEIMDCYIDFQPLKGYLGVRNKRLCGANIIEYAKAYPLGGVPPYTYKWYVSALTGNFVELDLSQVEDKSKVEFIINVNGSIKVIITDATGASINLTQDIDCIFENGSTSPQSLVHSTNNKQIQSDVIYPNPFNQTLNVDLNNIEDLHIFNVIGQEIQWIRKGDSQIEVESANQARLLHLKYKIKNNQKYEVKKLLQTP